MEKQVIYRIAGEVVRGKSLGRQLGFPTANIRVADQAPLANGVYAAAACIDGRQVCAVVNVGRRPTVDEAGERLAEVHFMDFGGNLYGRRIEVGLLEFLRPERRFGSVEELKRQICEDVRAAARCFAEHPLAEHRNADAPAH